MEIDGTEAAGIRHITFLAVLLNSGPTTFSVDLSTVSTESVGYKHSHFPSNRPNVLAFCFIAVLNRSHVHDKKEIKFTDIRFNNCSLFM
jgi:hypothetical protein